MFKKLFTKKYRITEAWNFFNLHDSHWESSILTKKRYVIRSKMPYQFKWRFLRSTSSLEHAKEFLKEFKKIDESGSPITQFTSFVEHVVWPFRQVKNFMLDNDFEPEHESTHKKSKETKVLHEE